MNSVNTLLQRIDREVEAEVLRQKAAGAEVLIANRQRELRLRRYEAEAKRLLELLKPRLDAFTVRFKAVVQVVPEVREHTRAVNLSFASTVAKASLCFEIFPDQDVNHVRLECTQEIIPVVVRYDKQSVLEFPLGGVRDDEAVRWFDDRVVAFVKAYLGVVARDDALREHLKGLLVEDPVNGVFFPKHLASSTLERDGRTYYFVDEDTRRQFEQRPAEPGGGARTGSRVAVAKT